MSEDILDVNSGTDTGGDSSSSDSSSEPVDFSQYDSAALFTELKNRLPEELRHENLNSHKSFDTVAKSYIEKDKMIGQKAPKAPDDPKAYGVPEGFDLKSAGISDEDLAAQQEYYKSLNIPEEQGKALIAKWLETENGIMQGMRQQGIERVEQANKYLEDTFGEGLEDAKREASQLLNSKLSDDVRKGLQETGLLSNQYFIHAIAEIAKDYRDDTQVIKPSSGSVNSAKEEYDKLKSDPEFRKELFSTDRSTRLAATKRWESVSQKYHNLTRGRN